MSRFDVAVIGAGFAGLSAATALAEAGARVIVLEARPTLGGRASAFRDPATGERVDNGQHILMGCYEETLRFLARIGTANRVLWQSGLAVTMIDRQGHQSTLRLPPGASPWHLLGGVFAWDALSWRERLSVLRIGDALRMSSASRVPARVARDATASRTGPGTTDPDPNTDDGMEFSGSQKLRWGQAPSFTSRVGSAETVREWLVRHGQAPKLCELLWEPLALAALNQSIDRAAAAHFVCVLKKMFVDAAAASLVLPSVPLDELYANPATTWLRERGSEIRASAPAHVRLAGGRVAGVRVRDEHIDVPIVISAVPWFALASIFDEPPNQLAATLHDASVLESSAIVTVNLWFDRPILDRPLVGLPGRVFQWVFDKGAIFGNGTLQLSLVASGANALTIESNESLVERALTEIRAAVPAARAATLRKASAVREKRATFSLEPTAPPRPQTKTEVEGFILAGDWIDTGLPATIESAVVSGHAAAQTALNTKGTKIKKHEGHEEHEGI